MKSLLGSFRVAVCLLVSAVFTLAYAQVTSSELATEHLTSGGVNWQINADYDTVWLVVAGPDGEVFRKEFGSNPSFGLVDNDGQPLRDGSYNYELVLTPTVDPSVRETLEGSREEVDKSGPLAATKLAQELGLPTEAAVFPGHFQVLAGSIVTGGAEASSFSTLTAPSNTVESGGTSNDLASPTQVIGEDLIVLGSICGGTDCANGESFGFDTLRLKENNTRLKFMDTSNSGSFPTNDWQLTANDSTNGGEEKFTIDDVDNGRTPFTIEATAPSSSLYVDSGGLVGFGTSAPVVELHSKDGDSPTLRLEQDGSSGFTPQTWDVVGNEANFFVRDVTNGSKLPFRILPNAGDRSIVIAAAGVGLGTDNPQDRLHVANGILRLEATDGTTPGLRFANADQTWLFENGIATGIFAVRDETTGTTPFRVFPGGQENTLVLVNGQVGVGTTNPSAKLDVSGPIIQRGGLLQADYVFEPGYELESIEEHSAFMWKERHLPAVPAMRTDANGEEVVEIGAQSRGILEELEKAHIYIEQLNLAILEKEDRIQGLESENAAILDRLQRLETLLSALTLDEGVEK